MCKRFASKEFHSMKSKQTTQKKKKIHSNQLGSMCCENSKAGSKTKQSLRSGVSKPEQADASSCQTDESGRLSPLHLDKPSDTFSSSCSRQPPETDNWPEMETVGHWNPKLDWEESIRKSVFERPLLSLKGELNDGFKWKILKVKTVAAQDWKISVRVSVSLFVILQKLI